LIGLDDAFLRGSYPPLVTPFRDGQVDYDQYAELVEFQITSGSHGIVVCGTTGEPTSLSVDERTQLLQVAVECASGRIPVVAATGSQSYEESALLLEYAGQIGASAAMIVTPYYSKPPQRGLVEYYVSLGKQTDLPLLLYLIPDRAAVDLTLESIERIVERIPHVVGLKHSGVDLGLVTQILARLGPEFRIFAGLEELSLPSLAVGAAGMINALGNLVPRNVAQVYEHFTKGDLAAARQLHLGSVELAQALAWDAHPIPLKYMLKRVGLLDNDEHRLPMVPATEGLQRRIDELLLRAGLLQAPAEPA
jgi:4-hydroxy-tetrahydrodipicolinate synthase